MNKIQHFSFATCWDASLWLFISSAFQIEPSKFSSAVLVNNAGTLGDITKMISSHSDVEKIHCYMGLNVTSPFYLM